MEGEGGMLKLLTRNSEGTNTFLPQKRTSLRVMSLRGAKRRSNPGYNSVRRYFR